MLPAAKLLEPARFLLATTSRCRSHYEVLGVPRNASQADIKKAFFTRSKDLHPDNPSFSESERANATAAFVELRAAYDVLRRPADRRAYDSGMGPRRHGPHTSNTYSYQDSTWFYENAHQQANSRNWSTGDDLRQSSYDSWRWVWRTTMVGIALVTLYNVGYVVQLHMQQRRLSKLIDEDEIARSFLRQPDCFADRGDALKMAELARVLKADVDDAWRRKQEQFGSRNRDEIREEHRWMRAVQDAGQFRSIKERRAAAQRATETDS